ncbi:MAG: CRISPR-associated endonuclease Cas3'' [Candidatus Riflebacteria bacterium]
MSVNNSKNLIAHVKSYETGEWASPHLLLDHVQKTAELAKKFASAFNSAEWAYAAGILHDAGKGTAKWQAYIRAKSGYGLDAHLEGKVGKLDHSTLGSKLAEEMFGSCIGRVIAYCIAGHHGGLPDFFPSEAHGASALKIRLNEAKTSEICSEIMTLAGNKRPNALPFKFGDDMGMSLWIRMLFSCLVDADFLDTESYMDVEKGSQRGKFESLSVICDKFWHYMGKKVKDAKKSRVNDIRQQILSDCKVAGNSARGIFSLTVPTGGGKTLSSLAFAVEHAQKHNLQRIIYVIPYTSIIEQNADVFRDAVGAENVVEHHSSIGEEDSTPQMRLASENWDAPLIVTTTVQFYESLFSNKPSRCRKLHNIANSVVILDEAQLLPTDYLNPILQALQILVDFYSVSLVVSTATQPALESRSDGQYNFHGLRHGSVKEIIKDVDGIYEQLKRVEVELPPDLGVSMTWQEVANECSRYEQVLVVVSDRKSCKELYNLMPEGTIHLSALMCGQHRSNTITAVKERLKAGAITRVISTQLVEAGVDLDFPVVYRALAGLDSIAQAAGRCNREGLLEKGLVRVFVAEKKSPPGILRKAAETTRNILYGCNGDPLERANFSRFFCDLYWKVNSLDVSDIIPALTPDRSTLGIQFRTAAEKFKLIDDSMQKSVLVRYLQGAELIDQLKRMGPEPWLMRKLQRYSVNIYLNDFNSMLQRKSLEEVHPSIFALTTSMEYSEETGLCVEDNSIAPEAFVL